MICCAIKETYNCSVTLFFEGKYKIQVYAQWQQLERCNQKLREANFMVVRCAVRSDCGINVQNSSMSLKKLWLFLCSFQVVSATGKNQCHR